jgi:hypothetical protein
MKVFFIIVFTAFACCTSFSQFDGYNTYYYNYSSNLAYSNEINESVAVDSAGDFYVAGERSKETADQALHVIKYLQNGTSLSVNITASGYKDYVKKVLVGSSYIYIICNAVKIATNQSYLRVYRLTTSLQKSGAVLGHYLNNPADAELDDSGNVYVLCYRANDSTGLAVLKLNSNLNPINTFAYNYKYTGDNYAENPTALYYNVYDNAMYVAGNVQNNTNNLSASLLIKLNAATNAQSWKKVSSFTSGKNTFSDVRASSKRVYAIGTKSNHSNAAYLDIESYNYAGKSPLVYTYNDTLNNFKTEGFKISFTSTYQVNFAGIAKDSINSKCNIILGVLSENFGLPSSVYSLAMPYNTTLNDAVTNQLSLYNLITGNMQVGTNQYMFLYGYSGNRSSININYHDTIINRSAAGNSIAFFDPAYACVAGYQDTRPNTFQPHDYQFFTRIYYDHTMGISGKNSSASGIPAFKMIAPQLRIFPNPSQHYVNIETSEAIHEIAVTDIKGNIVMRRHFTETLKLQTLDISSLTAGVYMLSIDSGRSYKIIKQ